MIARAESGQASTPMIEFDAAEIARGVGELYDPLADEKGLALKVEAAASLPVRGNRELVTQALANLVDNAIKYARPHGAEADGGAGRYRGARRAATATTSGSACPITARAFPRPIASVRCSASCGWNRAAPSRVPGWA